MSWTDQKVEKLKELWGKGNTASQIAEILGGVSRNAVIGKAHRLNLSAKIKTRTATSNESFENSIVDKNINQKTREKVMLESGDYTFRLQQGNSANASYSFIVYLD